MRGFSSRSPQPGGDFEIPRGQHAVPEGRSGGPRARRAARGDFQNPRTGDGDLQVKIPEQKPEFYIYFCIFKQTSQYNLYTNKPNFSLLPSDYE